jgi:hypothetical protein
MTVTEQECGPGMAAAVMNCIHLSAGLRSSGNRAGLNDLTAEDESR